MSGHRCHAIGCQRGCPPRWLMCRPCWSKVPPELAAEVYRTVALRGESIDSSWAPWWRAQARAIAHLARLSMPDWTGHDAFLAHEMAFADRLEAREAEGATR